MAWPYNGPYFTGLISAIFSFGKRDEVSFFTVSSLARVNEEARTIFSEEAPIFTSNWFQFATFILTPEQLGILSAYNRSGSNVN